MKTILKSLCLLIFIISTPVYSMTEEVKETPSVLKAKKPKILLSCDGGGMRAVGTVKILSDIFDALEQRLRRKIQPTEVFDLVGGTSAGGFVAAMIASGKSLQECLDLFMKHGREIFYVKYWREIKTLGGIWGTVYSVTHLESCLKSVIGDALMTETVIPFFVTTYCTDNDQFYVLSSDDTPETTQFPGLKKYEALRATSAAPTYFDAKKLQHKDGPIVCVDGGLGANDPAAQVLAKALEESRYHDWKEQQKLSHREEVDKEHAKLIHRSRNHPQSHAHIKAQALFPEDTFLLISVGTGQSLLPPLAPDAGMLDFALDAFSYVMSATRAATRIQLETELGPDYYYRLQFQSDESLDTTDPVKLQKIIDAAASVSKDPYFSQLIDKLAEILS